MRKKKETPSEFIASSLVFFVLAVPLFLLFTFLTSLIFSPAPDWVPILGGFIGPILAAVIADKTVKQTKRH